MYIFGYLRASTAEQNAKRAQDELRKFAEGKGFRVAAWYIENQSGASLQRPELFRLLDDAAPGDAILIEQIDRLTRLNSEGWETLKKLIQDKQLKIISLDLPTSHLALSSQTLDEFSASMVNAVNGMLLDMLAAIAVKDYDDRKRRQKQGIANAKERGKYKGRQPNELRHNQILKARESGWSIKETAELTGVSTRTVIRVTQKAKQIETSK